MPGFPADRCATMNTPDIRPRPQSAGKQLDHSEHKARHDNQRKAIARMGLALGNRHHPFLDGSIMVQVRAG